jgi:hypothetical protein
MSAHALQFKKKKKKNKNDFGFSKELTKRIGKPK